MRTTTSLGCLPLALLGLAICAGFVACQQKPGTAIESARTPSHSPAEGEFSRGVVLLHNFVFDEAAQAFRRAQQLDPDFALAYWGEALTYNHPLQRIQNVDAPRQILARFGASRTERAARAKTTREKQLIEAVDMLFAEGDEAERRLAYAGAMERLAEAIPEDDDIQAFYALALLSAAQYARDELYRTEVRAGAVALRILQRSPKHPGAAHYVIHAFDDPIHAPLALPAARVYAQLAPDSPHALHMPSHTFLQLGLWDEVATSNAASYVSAERLLAKSSGEASALYEADVNHALDWKQYADLQRGDYENAWKGVERSGALLKASHSPAAIGVADLLLPRYVIETEKWQSIPISPYAPADCWLAVGMSAAKSGDLARADHAEMQLHDLARRSTAVVEVMHLEVQALVAAARGSNSQAIALMTRATELEVQRGVPRGAPRPLKPPHELFGEILLQLGRPSDAATQFRISLLRTPNRTRSVLGLARSAAQKGDHDEARTRYNDLLNAWRGSADHPFIVEATQFVKRS